MTCGVKLAFRSLNQITIIAATASATAMMEPITMPARAPTGRALLFPLLFAISEGGSGVRVVELRAALSEFEGVSVLSGDVMGIGPFAGLVSLAYSAHDGFLTVLYIETFAQSKLRKVPRP